jgi:hypothetical protein
VAHRHETKKKTSGIAEHNSSLPAVVKWMAMLVLPLTQGNFHMPSDAVMERWAAESAGSSGLHRPFLYEGWS